MQHSLTDCDEHGTAVRGVWPETVAERRKRLDDQIARLTKERDALPSDEFIIDGFCSARFIQDVDYLGLHLNAIRRSDIQRFVDWLAAHGYRAKEITR